MKSSPSVSLPRPVLFGPNLSDPNGMRVVDVISLYYNQGQELTWQLQLIALLEHLNHDSNSCSFRRGSDSKVKWIYEQTFLIRNSFRAVFKKIFLAAV
jgi:hypothetical protein